MAATLVEHTDALDVRLLNRVWARYGRTIAIIRTAPSGTTHYLYVHRVGDSQVRLSYQPIDGAADDWRTESISLSSSSCHLGGDRSWFVCPGGDASCLGRVAILHERNGIFRCRRCHGLRYSTQYEDALARAHRKLARTVTALTGEQPTIPVPDVPERPWGMHCTTYLRHLLAFDEAFARYVAAFEQAIPAA